MSKNVLRYDRLIEAALRSVVRAVIAQSAEHGLPAGHHFLITFRTDHDGVDMPAYLKAKHPNEMTIVLQHQFWGLEAEDNLFRVTLSFNKVSERLTIPFAAITGFSDPSVQFGLQFGPKEQPTREPGQAALPATAESKGERDAGGPAEVITLDSFRRK